MLTKVDQNTFGVPRGNCFAACVASLLGLKLRPPHEIGPHDSELYVPNFCYLYEDTQWYDEFIKWLKPRGYAPLTQEFPGDSAGFFAWVRRSAAHIPYIAGGPTSRGPHCCVYIGDSLWHDPNPRHGRKGLDEVENATFLLPDFQLSEVTNGFPQDIPDRPQYF